MIQEVKYNGYTAQPSDHMSKDGDLSLALGVVPEDGALKPIMPPSVKLTLGQGQKVVYIHTVNGVKHYIVQTDDIHGLLLQWTATNVHYLDDLKMFGTTEIYQVTSLNNTLIILADDGLHYFLWKADDYEYLGQKPPELNITFGLKGKMEYKQCDVLNLPSNFSTGSNVFPQTLSDDWSDTFTNKAMAEVNKFIKEMATEKGKFMFPFLVRCAYRLYDGTLLMHTAPVLMVPTTGTPLVSMAPQRATINDSFNSAMIAIYGMVCDLVYENLTSKSEIQKWGDIIKSVDVFISAPFYTFNTDKKCKTIDYYLFSKKNDYSICYHDNQLTSVYPEDKFPIYYQHRLFRDLISMTFGNPNNSTTQWGHSYHWYNFGGQKDGLVIDLPEKEESVLKEEIRNCSNFYLLKSIPIDKIGIMSQTITIDVPTDYLDSLVARESMSDDYDSHNANVYGYAFPYNARLNLCTKSVSYFKGYPTRSMFCLQSNTFCTYTRTERNTSTVYYEYIDETVPATVNSYNDNIQTEVYIKYNEFDILKQGDASVGTVNTQKYYKLYAYYPNRSAKKMRFIVSSNEISYALQEHVFLNGAVYFEGFYKTVEDYDFPNGLSDVQVPILNKIYTSAVNNPFSFPVSDINTVGMGIVYAICSSARALSQGQFGQFPLYAFTDEGIWALEVSSTGTYSARQPITREICTNIDSITQIDTAVLFASDRGIMLLQGSECVCISDVINTSKPFDFENFSKSEELVTMYEVWSGIGLQITNSDLSVIPFRDFLRHCKMVYDYAHQRIVVYYYNEEGSDNNKEYAYVYSLRSKQWGMMRSFFKSNVNSYPEALVMGFYEKDNSYVDALLDLSNTSATYEPALIISRPFDFDAPDVHKTIDTIIQRGNFPRSSVKQVLYGSNDLRNWHVVWSSVDSYMRGFRGTPYKAFRLAIIAQLEEHEDIEGFTVQYTPRLNNQLR